MTGYSCHGLIGDYLKRGNGLNEDELQMVASCCLLGLDFLHRKNIIHGVNE